MNFNQLHELRRDILVFDVLFHNHISKPLAFHRQSKRYDDFLNYKRKIINRYGSDIPELRQRLLVQGFHSEIKSYTEASHG